MKILCVPKKKRKRVHEELTLFCTSLVLQNTPKFRKVAYFFVKFLYTDIYYTKTSQGEEGKKNVTFSSLGDKKTQSILIVKNLFI